MQEKTKIRIMEEFGVTIAVIQDSEILDDLTIHALGEELLSLAIGKPVDMKLVLDFRRVNSLSSSALGVLIRFSKRVEERGGHLKFCCLKKNLYEIFQLTHLDRIFEFYDRREDAVDDF